MHLSQVLGLDVQVVVTSGCSSMIETMHFGLIKTAYCGPFSCVFAKSHAEGVEAISFHFLRRIA